jgi:hypothetical protein
MLRKTASEGLAHSPFGRLVHEILAGRISEQTVGLAQAGREERRLLLEELCPAAEAQRGAHGENRGTKETVALADEMFELVKSFAPELELKYNKFYIGLAKDGQPNNFVVFRAKKNSFRAEIRLPSSPDIDHELDAAGIDVMDYDTRWSRYRLRLTKNDIKNHSDLLLRLLKLSYGVGVDGATIAAQAKA